MALFSKKETLIRSMPLMAMMAAINVIFSLFTAFVPLLSVILIIFIPLTSTLVEVYCKDRYFPIYAIATLGLSVVVSLSAIDFTLFYLIPSVVTGYVFGLMAKKNFPSLWGILIASILQTGISFAFIPLIQLITEHNLIEDIIKILNVTDKTYFNNLLILMFFVVSLIQTILSFIVVTNELRKFGVKNDNEKDWRLPVSLATILSSGIAVGLYFVYVPISLLCVGFAWYFAVFSLIFEITRKQKVSTIIMASMLLVNLFAFAGLNQFVEKGSEFILLGIAPLCISLISLGFYFLKKQK
ncbi:MAG: hypothetical protein MJ222_01045 [Bacilli bacterium]|nr:hypothetical protein [Bacilli bacterium]